LRNLKKPTKLQDWKLLGYKSKWEHTIAQQLDDNKLPNLYETVKLSYTIPETQHSYKPDFPFKDSNVYIEAKGKFDANDRRKHLLLKEQYPDALICIVFQNANVKLRKGSPTSYGQWCEKHGIHYSHKIIKKEWIDAINKL
jgi:hypothetical protein